DDDRVAARAGHGEAGGAGGRTAGGGAQVDARARRQAAHQLAARILADRTDEHRGRAAARAGRGLVEALATRSGGITADQRLARARQCVAVPDMVDVERADHDHLCWRGDGHGAPGPGQAPGLVSTPAMVAVISVAMVPPRTARRPKRARSLRRSGASPPMPPIWIAIELKLAKPHSAYVAISRPWSLSATPSTRPLTMSASCR